RAGSCHIPPHVTHEVIHGATERLGEPVQNLDGSPAPSGLQVANGRLAELGAFGQLSLGESRAHAPLQERVRVHVARLLPPPCHNSHGTKVQESAANHQVSRPRSWTLLHSHRPWLDAYATGPHDESWTRDTQTPKREIPKRGHGCPEPSDLRLLRVPSSGGPVGACLHAYPLLRQHSTPASPLSTGATSSGGTNR